VIKTLTKVANTHALGIDRTLMEAIGIDADTPLSVTIQGGRLTVQPANVGIGEETVREPDGVAMSSRNRYLDPAQRADANRLYQALSLAQDMVRKGNLSVDRIKAEVTHHLSQSRRIRIIYVEVVDPDTMKSERTIRPGQSLLTVAIWLEQTRLIDNVEL